MTRSRGETGNVALLGALGAPVLALLVMGGVDLAGLSSERMKLQDAANGAALAIAKEMGAGASSGSAERAQALVLEQLGRDLHHDQVTATATVLDGAAIKLTVTSQRPSLLGAVIPDGHRISVEAVAEPSIVRPVCVLALNIDGEAIKVEDKALIEAPGCAVRSNDNIEVRSDAKLTAVDVQMSGIRKGSGPIEPEGQTGAPVSEDPFGGRPVDAAPCMAAAKKDLKYQNTKTDTLPAGVHRGNVEVSDTAFLTLSPGVHTFCDGDLTVKNTARLRGDGVTLLFHRTARFKFDNSARVDLIGSKTGSWAGFLAAAAADNTDNFEIKSVWVKRLEGVIYLPTAKLSVDTISPSGTMVEGDVSDAAKWTVAIVDELVVKGAPRLYLNDDYAGSAVPFPKNLNTTLGMRLAR